MRKEVSEVDRACARRLGLTVQSLRQQNEMTVQDVADWLGVTPSQVYKIERGDQTSYTPWTLVMLARLFGVSVDVLVPIDDSAERMIEYQRQLAPYVQDKTPLQSLWVADSRTQRLITRISMLAVEDRRLVESLVARLASARTEQDPTGGVELPETE